MGIIHNETALRLERLENIISLWEDFYLANKDPVTADEAHGQAEAYAHCRGMISRFAAALATGDEAGLADTLQAMEDDAKELSGDRDDEDDDE